MALTNNEELDVNGQQMRFSTQLIALKPLVDVTLALVGTATATGFVISVKSVYDNVGVLGLLTGDFIKAAGISAAVFGTDNGDGTYTFTGAGMTTGTITLDVAASLGVSAYEAANVLTVTIV